MTTDIDQLDEDTRRSRLVVHLARLVQRGAKVEEHDRYRAVVVLEKQKPSMLPNLLIAAAGVALFLFVGGVFFLLGAGMALLGWHRKLIATAERVRLLVRVDDLGQVSEMEMGTA
ncbi:MAG: hypothetical protein JWM90_2748 [Thermoleophilia bacterium]|nr:hypothetical protein [Thermoleophilia bacterium]